MYNTNEKGMPQTQREGGLAPRQKTVSLRAGALIAMATTTGAVGRGTEVAIGAGVSGGRGGGERGEQA